MANKIISKKVDAIGLEGLNVAGMLRRCKVKVDESNRRFLKNGQSRKKALNRSISEAAWTELTLKIEYLAGKHGKVVIKVNPRHYSCECRKCGHIDKLNRDRERFVCTSCGHIENADIGAAKTIRDRAIEVIQSMVHGNSVKPEPRGSKRPKNRKEKSPRDYRKRGEPGNLSNQDIKAAMS